MPWLICSVQRSTQKAVNRVEEFEKAAKKMFIDEPGQLKLLIVVDKLLTGFDATPPPVPILTSRCAITACFKPSAG